MPLPLVPIAGVALKYGAIGLALLTTARALRAAVQPGRTDQRAEDALDDLADGVAAHRARDRDQSNASAKLKRRVRIGSREWEIDAGLIARWRIRKV